MSVDARVVEKICVLCNALSQQMIMTCLLCILCIFWLGVAHFHTWYGYFFALIKSKQDTKACSLQDVTKSPMFRNTFVWGSELINCIQGGTWITPVILPTVVYSSFWTLKCKWENGNSIKSINLPYIYSLTLREQHEYHRQSFVVLATYWKMFLLYVSMTEETKEIWSKRKTIFNETVDVQ